MTLFKGAGVAIVTPFKGGRVDYPALGRLLDWQISQNIDSIVICGTTGEASTLNDKEHVKVVKYTVDKVNGRVPVIAGAGSNDTAHALKMSLDLKKAGVDGLLLVTPYYNKCTQKGLIEHYYTIADKVDLPIILYSVHSRTGVNISPSTVFELAKHPNIVGIKEASGDISQVVEIARCVSPNFALYSGNDDMTVPLLSVGGSGVISTVANIAPNETHQLVMKYLDGDTKGASEMQLSMKPLIDALFVEVNPIPVKAALFIMGKIDLSYRLPLTLPEKSTVAKLKKEMKAFGLI